MSLRDLSLRVAVLTALAKRVKDALDDARGSLQREMELSGADTVSAALPSGAKVAKIPLARRDAMFRVVDERALIEWVRARRPDEIETLERVRPSYLPIVLSIDGTGELPDGVELGESSAYLTVRSVDTDAITAAWRDGSLSPLAYLELGAGDG